MTLSRTDSGDASAAAPPEIRQLIGDNMHRWKRLVLAQSAALLVAIPLIYFWTLLLMDSFVHFHRGMRTAIGLGLLLIVFAVGRMQWRRWRALRLTEDEVALAIERRTGKEIDNRLINAVQLARESDDPKAIENAVVRQNCQELRNVSLPAATRVASTMWCIGLAVLAVLAGVLLQTVRPDQFASSARRLLLPLAQIEPVYQTWLDVTPGDLQADGDATIHIRIHGRQPRRLIVLRRDDISSTRETLAVPRDATELSYTFRNLKESLDYAVRGNDFTSPYYRITVHSPAELTRARVRLIYPEYTKLEPREFESISGDLEALAGTRAETVFVFDRRLEEASLLIESTRSPDPKNLTASNHFTRLPLRKQSETEFAGTITFRDVKGYRLETRARDGETESGKVRTLRVLADSEPKPELLGLDREVEVAPEETVRLKVAAHDDIGLGKAGLFIRVLDAGESQSQGVDAWRPAEIWPVGGASQFVKDHSLSIASLGAVEGERIELAARAVDNDPLKEGYWVSGPTHLLVIGGEGTALQLIYEQILRSERDLMALASEQEQMIDHSVEWIRKFNPSSGLRWDDSKTTESLANAMRDQARAQEQIRQRTGAVARDMVTSAGDLRLSVGLLADTEMVRIVQIIEAVPGSDDPQDKRSTLGDARLTQERTLRSLREIIERYQVFRRDWELANMTAFTGMLATRQNRLQEQSDQYAQASNPAGEALANATSRRQAKVHELSGLAAEAFAGMAQRTADVQPVLLASFGDAAGDLVAPGLTSAFQKSTEFSETGSWEAAGEQQSVAAEKLDAVYAALEAAREELARQLLAALEEKAKSSVEAQNVLDMLKAGSADGSVTMPEDFSSEDFSHFLDVAQGKRAGRLAIGDRDKFGGVFDEAMLLHMQRGDSGRRQKLEDLSLPTTPGSWSRAPSFSDLPPNKVYAVFQERYDDLIGDLLDEADIMEEYFDTLNITMALTLEEAGDVGKLAGPINATAAAAATGNQKPPPTNVGGVSRTGRQGARSHGMTLSTEAQNLRGRDRVQEGQDRAPDQKGSVRLRDSKDPQRDTSTGLGGKKVITDEPVSFNVSDAGKFDPAVLDRMGQAREKTMIVERMGEKVAANLGDLMRDFHSSQQQVIERLKAIRKEFKNLYLPTDHLDELLDEWGAATGRLNESPDAEGFRMQWYALQNLRRTVRVYGAARTGFQPSLPRDQAVRGKVLDEAPRQVLPGYEDVVKNYYELLARGGRGE